MLSHSYNPGAPGAMSVVGPFIREIPVLARGSVVLAGVFGALALAPAPRPVAYRRGAEAAAARQGPVRYFHPRWSPDGRRIMFSANLENPRRLDLFTIGVDGSGLAKLRDGAHDGSWSPDGARVVFASMVEGDLELLVMNADGADVRQLTSDSTMDYLPSWSPDGRRLVFVSIPRGPGQRHDLHVMDSDGTGRRVLMETPASEETSPRWSGDGRRVVFATNRDGNWEIYAVAAAGGDAQRLTNDDAADNAPLFSPDGRSIGFVSDRGGARRMWVMRSDGSHPAEIPQDGVASPAWSPDGRWIAYLGQADGAAGVFVMSADGSGARRVTPVPAPPANRLGRMRWLAGCWELRTPQRVTLEMWMPPDGELMLGASRTVAGGVTREFEQLRLQARGDTLVYTATPSGQRETAFRSTETSDSGFTVENLTHDFPQRIAYQRRGADSLIARIEGPGPGGPRGIDFPMRRVACTAP